MRERLFGSPGRIAAAIVALGVVLLLPSLGVGFLLDDYIYLATVEGEIMGRTPDHPLFDFFVGDEAEVASWASRGFVPWWTWDGLRIRFFRPLSVLTFRLDHALFGKLAPAYHLHSLAWWCLFLAEAWLFYRDPDHTLRAGDRIERGTLAVEILEVGEGGPRRVRFRFARDLEDEAMCFAIWQDGNLRQIAPPASGQSLVLAREIGPAGF